MTDQERSQIRSYQLDGLTPKQISELTGIGQNIIEFSTGKPWQIKLLSVHPLHGSNLPVERRMKGASPRIRN